MKIIGISGKRGSGKSTLAHMFVKHGYCHVSLATNLKERCLSDFDLAPSQVYGEHKESPTVYRRTDGTPLTGRDIMIRMGIFYRSIDPLYWCRFLMQSMEEFNHPSYVIDDIRFLNEIKYFKSMGTMFVRLERKPELNIYKAALDDLSESELDGYTGWDFVCPAENNVTINDLEILASRVVAGVQ